MTLKFTPDGKRAGKVDRDALAVTELDDIADALDECVAALRELVTLKDIKDQSDYNLLYAQTTGSLEKGKELELEYRSRKQDAWRAARDALRKIGAEHD